MSSRNISFHTYSILYRKISELIDRTEDLPEIKKHLTKALIELEKS